MDNIEGIKMMTDKSTATDRQLIVSSIFADRTKQLKQGFRKKLIALKQDKTSLEEAISKKNAEIEALKQSVSSLNDVIDSLPLTDLKTKSGIAMSKITELNKTNQVLRTELDICRSKNAKLEMKLSRLEAELKRVEGCKRDVLQKMSQSGLEDFTVKFNQTKQKLFESLNLNVELKNQLKLAQKCIQQEIGENVNLNSLASAGTSWRGRAQTIMSLQLKINDLKVQLGAARSETAWAEGSLDEPPVRKEQIYHRAEVDVLQKDIANLTGHIEELNQKIAALKSRNNNLLTDMAKLKEKCVSAEAATMQHDNALETLHEKLRAQRLFYENKIRDCEKQINSTQKYRSNFEFQQEALNVKLENLQETLKRKEEQIQNLNEIIKNLEKDLRSVCGDFLFDCRTFRKGEFVGMLESLETEKRNLLELNRTINERLEEERNKVLSQHDQISKQRIKICRLEGRIRDLEKSQGSQIEKKKRSQRISDYAKSLNKSSSVTSFVFENTSFTDIISHNDQEKPHPDVLDLQNKLEIAQEKISLLEDRLIYLHKEKQSDAVAFENIIKSSRSVFLETVNNWKDKSSPSLSSETETKI